MVVIAHYYQLMLRWVQICFITDVAWAFTEYDDDPVDTFFSSDFLRLLLPRVLLWTMVIAGMHLLYPILFPVVISYPWAEAVTLAAKRRDRRRHVVFAGSFNPPHHGHAAMIQYLRNRFGYVQVVVGYNPTKIYPVSPQDRVSMLQKIVQSLPKQDDSTEEEPECIIHVRIVEGYIWRFVKPQGAQYFIRGIRNWDKDGPEERVLQIQNTWGPLVLGPLWWPIPTLYLQSPPDFAHVSSTLIRSTIQKDNDQLSTAQRRVLIQTMVPDLIVDDVIRLYGGKTSKKTQ
jgi:pantetheine-phosphate adenylyltransferase